MRQQYLRLTDPHGEDVAVSVTGEMGVRSRNDAVRMALTEQWIGLHEITSPADGDSSDGQACSPRGTVAGCG